MPLEKGDSFVGCPGGSWAKLVCVAELADGTYRALPEGSESSLDLWDGITREEISFDDAALWPAMFDRLRGSEPGVGRGAVHEHLRASGVTIDDQQMNAVWAGRCGKLFPAFDLESQLTSDQAYAFFLSAGISAKTMAEPSFHPSNDLYKMYWNGARMGGRNPDDVPSPVGLAEAVESLGLAAAEDDPSIAASLADVEKREGRRLPTTLLRLWTKKGALFAIGISHCNAPEPQAPGAWRFDSSDAARWGHAHAVRIMLPHQGDHAWWAVFDDGAEDAEVWLSFEEDAPPVRRVSRSLPFFFWDLKATGKSWELIENRA